MKGKKTRNNTRVKRRKLCTPNPPINEYKRRDTFPRGNFPRGNFPRRGSKEFTDTEEHLWRGVAYACARVVCKWNSWTVMYVCLESNSRSHFPVSFPPAKEIRTFIKPYSFNYRVVIKKNNKKYTNSCIPVSPSTTLRNRGTSKTNLPL